jgi:3-oxoadipate enol-lactonase
MAAEAIVAPMPFVGELHVEEEGAGPAVLFVHGGLGDMRLWEPVAHALAARFRCVRYDLRFYGESRSPGVEFGSVDDAIAILDALAIERAAIVGLSLGGGIALDVALAHPERVWALVHVAAGVTGMPVDPYTEEANKAFEEAEERGDVDRMMEIDFDAWAPLGADDRIRELWLQTPDARGVPDGTTVRPRPDAASRLEQVACPTLVVLAKHDPPAQKEVGATVAHRVPGARLVEIDSDHYLTLREPERVSEVLEEFLVSASSPSSS